MWLRAQRTVHTVGKHLACAVHTGARVANAVDNAARKYGVPIHQHAVRPILHAQGYDTGAVDKARSTYNYLRRAIK